MSEQEIFEVFWKSYPRKIAKKHASQMWARLTVEQQAKALEVIGRHVAYWQATGRAADKIPHAGSWLNGWRFDDELTEVRNVGNARKQALDGLTGKVGVTYVYPETHRATVYQIRADVGEPICGDVGKHSA